MNKHVVIIGAGPYALATAAFLRQAGVETQLYGDVMGFWKSMPVGMFLRSDFRASNIGDPEEALTLPAYERKIGHKLARPVPLADFIAYGEWFQKEAGIPVDPRRVTRLAGNESFEITLENGEVVGSPLVVVATGITPFPWKPLMFDGMPPELVSHTSAHYEYSAFAGQDVLVVGAGQSALESVALLHEAGANTELLCRRPALRFLRGERLHDAPSRIASMLYPSWGVGPPLINLLMGRPALYRLLPLGPRERLAYRAIRPAGASWLRPRLDGVTLTLGRTVASVANEGEKVKVLLDDGTSRTVDHVFLGTGYRIDVQRYPFLDPELAARIKIVDGYPTLSLSFESSVPGLYFVGAPGARSGGPGMRFVSHTAFTARALARAVLRRP